MLYDGECALCCGSVRFVLAHETEPVLTFASFQGPTGQALLREHGLPTEEFVSFVILEENVAHTRMAASVRLMHHLGGIYRGLATLCTGVPRVLGDAFYSLVFVNRRRIFGDNATCTVPDPDQAWRFRDGYLGVEP